MSDSKEKEKEKETPKQPAEHKAPEGAEVKETWRSPGGPAIRYTSRGAWTVLRDKDKPVAEIYSTSYVAARGAGRPVTFIFNGGPGAASAYLHVGALGPRRAQFNADGTVPAPPARLAPNAESWLAFTDLVFVDPVGTGWSRAIPDAEAAKKAARDGAKPREDRGFWGLNKDLKSLGEFMCRWLSAHDRWESPVFVAGESYGGYRAAKLARSLQESHGIALNGAVLISPALEFALLDSSDYDALPWIDRLPTMAAAAAFHGRSGVFKKSTPLEKILAGAEAFATGDYAALLAQGASMPAGRRARILARTAKFLGLPQASVARAEGRIPLEVFARELLRADGKLCGRYDATITARDPFPDRDGFTGPDPTLAGIEGVFTAGINKRLRGEIGVKTDREYHLLSWDVNKGWRLDMERHALQSQIGATDDLRYGMSLNPHLKVFITHGVYDLVTPYYSTNRIRNLMRLDRATAANLTVRHFGGGHMFYAWETSRKAFTGAIRAFYASALPKRRK